MAEQSGPRPSSTFRERMRAGDLLAGTFLKTPTGHAEVKSLRAMGASAIVHSSYQRLMRGAAAKALTDLRALIAS